MKNYTFLIALCLSIFTTAQTVAVSNSDSPWSYGAKFGLNMASLDGDYLDVFYVKEAEGFIGFHGGGWINYQISPMMSVQAELLGSLQGGDLTFELDNNGVLGRSNVEVRLPYIVIPVSFKYAPLENAYLEIGPQMNVLVKEDFAYELFINDEPVEDDEIEALFSDRLKDSRRFDVGINIGAGYEIIDHWTVYTRYTLGLMKIDDREEKQQDLKNRVFAFGVSYGF